MSEYGAVENQMDGMIRDIEELRTENEKLKAENKTLKRCRVLIPKPTDFSDDGLLFVPEGLIQLYNGEEVEKIVKERDEYKHRAEVAERALRNAAPRLKCRGGLGEGFCGVDKCDYYHCNNDEGCVKAHLQQAEKELAEEGNK